MNDITVFLTTEVKHTGFLSTIGDFFLAPARFFFSGKTIIVERNQETDFPKPDGHIAKVSSFYLLHEKTSKQETSLKSTTWGTRKAAVFIPILFLIALLPATIIGSIIKGLAYSSPFIRQAHKTVKKRLITTDMTIASQDEPIQDHDALALALNDYLLSGQKTNALIIYAELDAMNELCLKLIKKINPLKLILVGHWTIENFNIIPHLVDSSAAPLNKQKSWDISALMPQVDNHFNYPDQDCNIVSTVDKALTNTRCSFFNGPKHTIYVVQDEPIIQPQNAP